ncbi:replication initiation protein RepC [Ochrobactrum sp. BTU1]|uniref:replication initiation protein RepC n=1 Tax=Ochrobactrum sp. BTU1 TaxID=2840456 RepID=UPI001C05047A|nr:hypothetical protein KMS41_19685 [Ochrobactrum sp. BTU1]
MVQVEQLEQVRFEASRLKRKSKATAVTLACILQQANHINSIGGYLRPLTRKVTEGKFTDQRRRVLRSA